MNPNELAVFTLLISVAGTLLTNVIGKMLSRRQDLAGAKAQEGDAAKDISDAVSTLLVPLKLELSEVRADNTKLRGRVIAMEDEVANLKLDLRRVNDAFEYLVGVSRETFPDHVERAIKIRKGDA